MTNDLFSIAASGWIGTTNYNNNNMCYIKLGSSVVHRSGIGSSWSWCEW